MGFQHRVYNIRIQNFKIITLAICIMSNTTEIHFRCIFINAFMLKIVEKTRHFLKPYLSYSFATYGQNCYSFNTRNSWIFQIWFDPADAHLSRDSVNKREISGYKSILNYS